MPGMPPFWLIYFAVEDPDTIAVRKTTMGISRRYEYILVGSNAGNARWVLLNRQISSPSP